MRVPTAFKHLLRLPGVNIRAVEFIADSVVVTVALRRRRLVCPLCDHSTRAISTRAPVAVRMVPYRQGRSLRRRTDRCRSSIRYTQSGAALAGFTVAVSHRRWVPSSVGSASQTATSTAKSEEQKNNGSSRAASQPSGSEDRGRSDQKHNGEWQDVNDGLRVGVGRSLAGMRPPPKEKSEAKGSCRTASQLEETDVVRNIDRCTAWRSVAENAAHTLKKGMRIFVAGKLVQRTFEVEGQKRQTVEIQVTNLGPDLQFATAEVAKSSTEGSGSSSDGPSAASSAEEKQSAQKASFWKAPG